MSAKALCTLPASDLSDALAKTRDAAPDVYYGPGVGGYAIVVDGILSMVTPLHHKVVNGTADAASWRAALASLADGDSELAQTVTVYEHNGALTLSDASAEATKPSAPAAPAQPVGRPVTPLIKPLATPSSLLPATSTYHVIDGLLTLAELYTHGGAQVRHDALRRSWDVRTSARSAYRVQLTGTATELTSYQRTGASWQAMETLCLPALPLHEQFRLFMNRSTSK